MRKAITTKFIAATLAKPARVKASAGSDSASIDWDFSRTEEQNHIAAASALALELAWFGPWLGGSTPDGFAFVRPDPSGLPTFAIPYPND